MLKGLKLLCSIFLISNVAIASNLNYSINGYLWHNSTYFNKNYFMGLEPNELYTNDWGLGLKLNSSLNNLDNLSMQTSLRISEKKDAEVRYIYLRYDYGGGDTHSFFQLGRNNVGMQYWSNGYDNPLTEPLLMDVGGKYRAFSIVDVWDINIGIQTFGLYNGQLDVTSGFFISDYQESDINLDYAPYIKIDFRNPSLNVSGFYFDTVYDYPPDSEILEYSRIATIYIKKKITNKFGVFVNGYLIDYSLNDCLKYVIGGGVIINPHDRISLRLGYSYRFVNGNVQEVAERRGYTPEFVENSEIGGEITSRIYENFMAQLKLNYFTGLSNADQSEYFKGNYDPGVPWYHLRVSFVWSF